MQVNLKANHYGLLSAALIFASLLLPWLSATFYQLEGTFPNIKQDFSLNAGLTTHYFGFIGYANGITQLQLFPYWFNLVFTAVLAFAGLLALKGSLSKRATGRKLMVLAGVLAIICCPLFYVAFVLNMFSQPFTSDTFLFNVFAPESFGLNASELGRLHTKTGLSFYWLPIVAGALAIISIKTFKKDDPPQEVQGQKTA